jgi:hypothetical protein
LYFSGYVKLRADAFFFCGYFCQVVYIGFQIQHHFAECPCQYPGFVADIAEFFAFGGNGCTVCTLGFVVDITLHYFGNGFNGDGYVPFRPPQNRNSDNGRNEQTCGNIQINPVPHGKGVVYHTGQFQISKSPD